MYLREIIFVTNVVVLTIETFLIERKARVETGLSEPVWAVSFLKILGYLFEAFEIGKKGNIEGRERGCRQNLYLLTTQIENLHAISDFNIKTFVALNYT